MDQQTKTNQGWDGVDRRRGIPPVPMFAELLMEAQWRPTDRVLGPDGGWFRASGYAQDRRQKDRPA